MKEKMIVLVLTYAIALLPDLRASRTAAVREKWMYYTILTLSIYYCVDYLTIRELPDMHTVVDHLLTAPARQIVGYLKVKPS
ncbi:hypothetical protein PaecuDRAFT_3507 [Paenibacillus curdlanolyticus YK9]|uniref:Uncharacterized protein n=1 Tax=Paenibacillus curdlanolyticus YK9 TaxID=717606 RepID=E0ID05_9BACL|nr:hypothetical protein [Paenibacillus curdlanolyticus]EFM09460.1 hypothetical protein PaecuDRAFT_3507 [Paenibacillus curdlanolyticus YK9]